MLQLISWYPVTSAICHHQLPKQENYGAWLRYLDSDAKSGFADQFCRNSSIKPIDCVGRAGYSPRCDSFSMFLHSHFTLRIEGVSQ